MPITQMKFENGIFFAYEEGRISKEDAKIWAKQAALYAANSPTPIVALVDALNVVYISTDARKVFVRASRIPNVKCAAVAAKNIVTEQTAKIIGLMADDGHTYVFSTLSEAHRFALDQLRVAGV
jgi:hypothetical protein